MAYTKLSLDRYNERKLIVDRLKRLNEPFSYTATVSLTAYEAIVEKLKVKADVKNAHLDASDLAGQEYAAICLEEEQMLIAFRAFIGADKGKSSDEFVFAGGARQSDVIAQQQQKREDKKKAANNDTPK
jgi:hypothetical protein